MKTIDQVEVGNVIQNNDRIATVSEVARTPDGEISAINANFGVGIPLQITNDFANWTILRESW